MISQTYEICVCEGERQDGGPDHEGDIAAVCELYVWVFVRQGEHVTTSFQ